MNDESEPRADDEQQLARTTTGQSGSLLRLRDVQALNRSFRRLAEVQEALLDRLDRLEEERSEASRWQGPWMAMGGVVLGLSIAVLAYVLWQNKEPLVVPPAATPEITVQAPDVTVQAPENTELAAAMAEMNSSLTEVLTAQKEDRDHLGQLTERLLLSEQQKNDLMREFALAEERYQRSLDEQEARVAAEEAAPAPLHTPAEAGADVDGASPDRTWVGVLNGLLAIDGYSSLRLQKATRVEGEAALQDVVWMSWGRDGLADTVIRAARVELELHRMAGTLVLRFFDGNRVAGGMRTELPEQGLRLQLESIDAAAWVRHFPELQDGALAEASPAVPEPAPEAQPGEQPPVVAVGEELDAMQVRKALDDLISHRGSFSYYRLNSLGEVDGKKLKYVQINWHDNSGRLVKTIEADSLEVILHPAGSVELLLRNGAFLDGGVKSPFSADRFRLHLPSQDLDSWRSSGVPYVESDN